MASLPLLERPSIFVYTRLNAVVALHINSRPGFLSIGWGPHTLTCKNEEPVPARGRSNWTFSQDAVEMYTGFLLLRFHAASTI